LTRSFAASADQARALDGAAGRLGISSDALMAVASFQCARLAQLLLVDLATDSPVAVLAGRGNNGGDALGCARHLAAWGHVVKAVTLADLADPEANSSRQAQAARAAGVELRVVGAGADSAIDWALEGAALIIDGLLGTGGSGPIRGVVADAVRQMNANPASVLAIDVPSGLDPTRAEAGAECVRASATLMLAIPKSGCLSEHSRDLVGRLWLADIGVPAEAYLEVGFASPVFAGAGLEPCDSVSQPELG